MSDPSSHRLTYAPPSGLGAARASYRRSASWSKPVNRCSDPYASSLRIAVADTRDYERLLSEKLYKIPGIRHSKSSFVLRQLKRGELPLGS